MVAHGVSLEDAEALRKKEISAGSRRAAPVRNFTPRSVGTLVRRLSPPIAISDERPRVGHAERFITRGMNGWISFANGKPSFRSDTEWKFAKELTSTDHDVFSAVAKTEDQRPPCTCSPEICATGARKSRNPFSVLPCKVSDGDGFENRSSRTNKGKFLKLLHGRRGDRRPYHIINWARHKAACPNSRKCKHDFDFGL